MALNVVNFDTLEWQEYPGGGVVRFEARWAPLADRLGARKLGYGSWIVPPGKASVPYHYHLVNEELAIVMGGEIWVRLDGRFHRLEAGDAVALPPGPDSAHQFLNHADRPAHLLLFSTKIPREVVGYPDSGKRMMVVAGLASDPPMERVLMKDGRVLEGPAAYFEGEPIDEPLGDPPTAADARDPRIVRFDDLPWEAYRVGSFGAERRRVARAAGARRLGYGQLRHKDGTADLEPGDAFACPPGPAGAHAFLVTGDAPLELFALSTMEEPEVIEYPDSDKLNVLVGAAPGGDPGERRVSAVFRRMDHVAYEEGER